MKREDLSPLVWGPVATALALAAIAVAVWAARRRPRPAADLEARAADFALAWRAAADTVEPGRARELELMALGADLVARRGAATGPGLPPQLLPPPAAALPFGAEPAPVPVPVPESEPEPEPEPAPAPAPAAAATTTALAEAEPAPRQRVPS